MTFATKKAVIVELFSSEQEKDILNNAADIIDILRNDLDKYKNDIGVINFKHKDDIETINFKRQDYPDLAAIAYILRSLARLS